MPPAHKNYSRWQTETIKSRLTARRAVLLTGARQSGKSFIARELAAADDIEYRNLDNPAIQRYADTDPRNFVKHNQQLLLLDEIQRVPDLLHHLKQQIEADNASERYLLASSTDIAGLPQVAEPLADRVAEIRLRPLTQGEVLLAAPSFIRRCFAQDFKPGSEDDCSFKSILELALRGGFPEALELPEAERFLWHSDYVRTILARDLKEIANIQRAGNLRKILKGRGGLVVKEAELGPAKRKTRPGSSNGSILPQLFGDSLPVGLCASLGQERA